MLTLLRPALEAVVDVVRVEEKARAGSAPRRLVPLLRFSRLPDAALATVLRVVAEDDALRARVASSVDEALVGEAGWAFLARPVGWDDTLRSLASALLAEVEAEEEERSERVAARRLAAVEAELRAAEARVTELTAEVASSATDLATERRARRAAESAVAALEARLSAVEKERDAAHRRASMLERAASSALPAGSDRPDEPSRSPSPSPSPSVDQGPPRRLPQPLPPGLLDDTPEAADALVRVPRAVLVVDGYNASISTWPGMSIAEQRDRLTNALAELAARSGVRVVVAFDGVDRGATASAGIQVRFSREGQQADDLILDLLDATPVDTPILVATNDQRVRREAAARGANLLTQAQLFWLLRRER